MLSMTFAFAENENTNAVNNVQAYDMKVNMNKLGQTLGLSWDQLEFVSDVHTAFCADMMNAAMAAESERQSAKTWPTCASFSPMRSIRNTCSCSTLLSTTVD